MHSRKKMCVNHLDLTGFMHDLFLFHNQQKQTYTVDEMSLGCGSEFHLLMWAIPCKKEISEHIY